MIRDSFLRVEVRSAISLFVRSVIFATSFDACYITLLPDDRNDYDDIRR